MTAYSPGDVHRLATRVARAARLADSPVGYYNAHADIRENLAKGWDMGELEGFYARYYGAEAWDAPAGEIIVAASGSEA